MALTRTIRHQQTSANGFGTGLFTTSNFTPANNTLLVAAIHAITTNDGGMDGTSLTIADSLGTLTWTPRIATINSPGWSYGHRVWTAPIGTGTSMNLQIDCGAEDVDLYRIDVFEYSDYLVASPVGGTALGTDADGDGPALILLSSEPEAMSQVLAFATLVHNSGTNSVAYPPEWAKLVEVSNAAAFVTASCAVRIASSSRAVDWTDLEVGGDTAGAVLGALEIRGNMVAGITLGELRDGKPRKKYDQGMWSEITDIRAWY